MSTDQTAADLVASIDALPSVARERLVRATDLSGAEREAIDTAIAADRGATYQLAHRILEEWDALSAPERTAALLTLAEHIGSAASATAQPESGGSKAASQ